VRKQFLAYAIYELIRSRRIRLFN